MLCRDDILNDEKYKNPYIPNHTLKKYINLCTILSNPFILPPLLIGELCEMAR